MKPRQGANENFAMVSLQELMGAVVEATADRRLQLRDSAVVLGLVAHMNWRTGRCNVKGTVLAEQLKMKQPDVAASIKRLKVEGLLTRAVDPIKHEAYYLFNPRLIWVGGEKRGYLFHLWDELTKKVTLDELEEAG